MQSSSNEGCEYCIELHDPERSRFHEIYQSAVGSRIVRETDRYAVMPTIGQLVAGSMLIIPKRHVETLASIGRDAIAELCEIAEELCGDLKPLGQAISFEHGAQHATGGGCGIYHAHLHVVPLPRAIHADQLLPRGERFGSLPEALGELSDASEYLVMRDSMNVTVALDLSTCSDHAFPSQYFRRRIVETLGLNTSWDWRACTAPERLLVDTVAFFGSLRRTA